MMADLENPTLPEKAKSLQCDYHLKNHPEVLVPVVAECIDEAPVDLNCVNPGELGFKNGAHPPENLIDYCRGEKVWGTAEAEDGVLDLKSGCPKDLLDSSVLLHSKAVVAMDLLGKEDLGLDLETGNEINGGEANYWGSANKLFGKAWNDFIQGDFGQTYDGSIAGTKTVEPTFPFSAKVDICKPEVDLIKSEVEVAVQKSEAGNGTNVIITELVGSGELRHENGNHHNKPSSKKPPRPPRHPTPPKVTTDPSKEKLMKDLLRRAKLERITSLKKKQIATSKPSNSSVWALTFTLCFCVVLLMQGIFSQGNGSVQISPEAAAQTSAISADKYVSHATNGQHLHAIEQDQTRYARDEAGSIQSDPEA